MLEIGVEYKFVDGSGSVIARERHPRENDIMLCELNKPSHRLHGKYFMFRGFKAVDRTVWPLPDLVVDVVETNAF